MQLNELFVMVVEPSRMQQHVIGKLLAEFGIESVRYCSTAGDALTQMLEEQPDIVISSFYLPDMTGADLVKAMRENPVLQELAFMLVSSETQFRYLDPVKQYGATAILPKPFSSSQLKTALNTTVHSLSEDSGVATEFDPELLRVLVVDDSNMARRFIIKVLQGLGVRHFTEAHDGAEALAIIAENYFDLVVTDYNMPNVNGCELTQQIRTQSAQQSVPIMMVTSEENEGRLSAVQQAGVSAICDKPFELEMVRELLGRLLNEA